LIFWLWSAVFAGAGVCAAPCAAAADDRTALDAFAAEVAQTHGLDAARLRLILHQAKVQPYILRAIAQPSTAKPWYLYRNGVVDGRRVDAGVRFWRENEAVIERASAASGVPPELIVATLGAETFYGRNTGGYRVLDALVTLAFHFPARAELFRAELEAFLLLAIQEKLDPLAVRGSYAGAMGIAQFLPSSYRKYAVDFDGNGRRDLWRTADAIGSVANYYQAHGWEPGGPVVATAEVEGTEFRALLDQGLKPHLALARLRALGVTPGMLAADETLVALIEIETEAGRRYLAGFQNFYVITRYNRSVNYALSVHELAREIRQQREAGR
jgi:membrane-bound lytic murein transglycosylase B